MPDLAFDLRYLKLVILVAEYGSFRAAAESQNLSQSTVSRRVQILEHRLGVALFERSPHGVQLTALGKRFIQSATGSVQIICGKQLSMRVWLYMGGRRTAYRRFDVTRRRLST